MGHDLGSFVDASPSPFHAAEEAARRLAEAGFRRLEDGVVEPGPAFVVRDGALIAWAGVGAGEGPLRVVGAHTDSPNLRVKPRPDTGRAGARQLAVDRLTRETFNLPLLAFE